MPIVTGQFRGEARPAMVAIGKQVFRHYFGDFPSGGLLVQVSRRWCTVVVDFVLFGAHKLCRIMTLEEYLEQDNQLHFPVHMG